jgi:hypothetical protein
MWRRQQPLHRIQIDPDLAGRPPGQCIALGAQREERQRQAQPGEHRAKAVATLAITAFLPQQRDQLAACEAALGLGGQVEQQRLGLL